MEASTSIHRPNYDFWIFLVGQTISNLGTSFTTVALPLLIFKLTESPIHLSIATSANFLPYLLFGLIMGAWVDRSNRKRLMIILDILRAIIIVSIPILVYFNLLSIWYIYVVIFLTSALSIGFNSAQFASIPELVDHKDLVSANSKFQAGFSIASAAGPVLAGIMITLIPVYDLFLLDALTFVISSLSLLIIRRDLSARRERASTTIRRDIAEGVRFVIDNMVLRYLSLMIMITVLVSSTANAQIIFFAKEHLKVADSQASLFYAASSIGWLVFSLIASRIRKLVSFSAAIIGFTILRGITLIFLGMDQSYIGALILWGLGEGLTMISNIYTLSFRQTITPNHLIGRILSTGQVTAWSMIPLGTLIGGSVIQWTGSVGFVYAVIGLLLCLNGIIFIFTPVGRAERYLHKEEPQQTEQIGV